MGRKYPNKHDFVLNVINGKVCNALIDTKSIKICYILFNELNTLQTNLSAKVPECIYSLSKLHRWISLLEFILNIPYRLEVKSNVIRTEIDKKVVSLQKKRTQKALNVDQLKPESRYSKNRNTPRRFFKSWSIKAIDKNFIRRSSVSTKLLIWI